VKAFKLPLTRVVCASLTVQDDKYHIQAVVGTTTLWPIPIVS